MLRGVLATAGMLALLVTGASAQNGGSGFSESRSLAAYLLGENESVTLDGRLDEPFWQRAGVATEFRTFTPEEGLAPPQPTAVRIAYSATTLYVAWEVTETRDGHYIANVRQRDGETGRDDFVRIFLDPHQTRRDAYMFVVHPLGARWDALLQNNDQVITNWDATWDARTERTATGWTAELAIPFSELSFPNGGGDWGFDAMRYFNHSQTATRWAQIERNLGTFDVSREGRLTGIHGIDTGLGIEAQVFGTTRYTHVWPEPGREDDIIFDASGNLFYKLTDSLTGTFTVNTDFSDTPLDDRIVSLSRFATFFEETRDFFLQDAAIFEFGGNNFGPSNGLPYFSRNIGRAEGQRVDLIGGGKVSGRMFGTDMGALVTYMGEGDMVDSQVLGVLRASREVLSESRVGLIATYGDPSGAEDNLLGGIDFQHVINLDNNAQINADFFFIDTYSGGDVGHGQAWGATAVYNSDEWWGRVRTKHLEENYNPALGFANRPDSRDYQAVGRRRWRPEGDRFDFIDLFAWSSVVTGLASEIESRNHGSSLEFDFTNGTYLGFAFDDTTEHLDSGFMLPGGVMIPAGSYHMQDFNVWWNGSSTWSIQPFWNAEYGSFFGGTYNHGGVGLNWRPSSLISLRSNHGYDNIDFGAAGRTEFYVGSLELTITPTPNMELITELQYDSISENFNVLSRFRWQLNSASEIFIAVGHSADVPSRDFPQEFESNVSTAVVRVGHTMRW